MIFIRKLIDDGQIVHYDPADKPKVMFDPVDKSQSIVLEQLHTVKKQKKSTFTPKKFRPKEIIYEDALFRLSRRSVDFAPEGASRSGDGDAGQT